MSKKKIPEKFIDYVAQAYYAMKLNENADENDPVNNMSRSRWLACLDIANILGYKQDDLFIQSMEKAKEIDRKETEKTYNMMKDKYPYMMEGKSIEDLLIL